MLDQVHKMPTSMTFWDSWSRMVMHFQMARQHSNYNAQQMSKWINSKHRLPNSLRPHVLVQPSLNANVSCAHHLLSKLANFLNGTWRPLLETTASTEMDFYKILFLLLTPCIINWMQRWLKFHSMDRANSLLNRFVLITQFGNALIKTLVSLFHRHFSRWTRVSWYQLTSFWTLLELRMTVVVVVTTGARTRVQLRSNRHHQHPVFYRPDALPVA